MVLCAILRLKLDKNKKTVHI